MNDRLKIAAQILAGFVANNAVFAHNGMTGWGLVNATPEQLCELTVGYADELIERELASRPQGTPTAQPASGECAANWVTDGTLPQSYKSCLTTHQDASVRVAFYDPLERGWQTMTPSGLERLTMKVCGWVYAPKA